MTFNLQSFNMTTVNHNVLVVCYLVVAVFARPTRPLLIVQSIAFICLATGAPASILLVGYLIFMFILSLKSMWSYFWAKHARSIAKVALKNDGGVLPATASGKNRTVRSHSRTTKETRNTPAGPRYPVYKSNNANEQPRIVSHRPATTGPGSRSPALQQSVQSHHKQAPYQWTPNVSRRRNIDLTPGALHQVHRPVGAHAPMGAQPNNLYFGSPNTYAQSSGSVSNQHTLHHGYAAGDAMRHSYPRSALGSFGNDISGPYRKFY